MKRAETALVLAQIAAIDNRRLDPPGGDPADPLTMPILSAWHDLIGDLNARDCLEAIRAHRKASTDWLTPAHVIEGVRRIREERLDRGPDMGELMGDVKGVSGSDWARIYRERRERVADGQTELRAITGGIR